MMLMDNMLHLQPYIVSISMLLVILIKIIKDKDNHSFLNKVFVTIVVLTLAILIIEALMWVFDGQPGTNVRIIVIMLNTIQMILLLISGALWMMYTDYSIYNSINRIKKLAIASEIILMYFQVLSVTAPLNGLLFYIDSTNTYHRGSWYLQSQCIYILFLAYVIIILLKNRNKVSRQVFIALLIYPIPLVIGIVLQMFFLRLSLAWSGISISILIIYIYVQSQKICIDYLTGLYNRRKLDLYLENTINRRSTNKLSAILMMDVDKFKIINDTWGHEMGDRALKHCAMILRECFHHKDFIARYAGDEFVVVLELKTNEDIHKVIKRLKDKIELINTIGDVPYKLSFSIGYALLPSDGRNVARILQIADERMYIEKSKVNLGILE